jgi:hypothetical protein
MSGYNKRDVEHFLSIPSKGLTVLRQKSLISLIKKNA